MYHYRNRTRIKHQELEAVSSTSKGIEAMYKTYHAYRRHRLRQTSILRPSFYLDHLVTVVLIMIIAVTTHPSTLLVQGLVCTHLEPPTLSSLYQTLSSPSRTTFLCPFTIEGPEACDTDAPFILDKSFLGRSKKVQCDFSGQCKINCDIDTHFIVKDRKELVLDSIVLQGARKGSVHVFGSNFRSIQSTWR